MSERESSTTRLPVGRVTPEGVTHDDDTLAVEEPMEIRVEHGPEGQRERRSLSVTMRTPGHDFDLATGFLLTEGIVDGPGGIDDIKYTGDPPEGRSISNIVLVTLSPEIDLDVRQLERHFFTTSSCGVCGKASLDTIRIRSAPIPDPGQPRITERLVPELPDRLRTAQTVFERTGGLHAAGLFDAEGRLLAVREDVGRHNAVDKVVGFALRGDRLPLSGHVLMVSGRISFEIVQKALVAGIPVIAAISAPTSLAVEFATRADMTLVGFLRGRSLNVYGARERVEG